MFRRLAIAGLLSVVGCCWARADFIDFRNASGTTTFGDTIDDKTAGASGLSVVGFPGLELSIIEIADNNPLAAPSVNANSGSFGVDRAGAVGTTGDTTDRFDANLSESVTLSFNRAVTVSSLSFQSFVSGEGFEFAGQTIASGTEFIFTTPFALAANQSFKLEATSGSIGFVGMDVTVTAVPEPSAFGFASVAYAGVFIQRRRRRSLR
ncbi:hypothetical protein [Rubripirellula reticaptiva]|uniref:SbsA Ig-like domain-containing protein n=1 Tax=Rubripirellula reticaptiva TaxID=2528013 RepID=A0A5C6F1S5_9BACT|nr:hypothetical protein [Rubripirellula reticaptiva]TWU55202.1 hypothetical protein Poly59_14990 [Rubripirellula reticaptiva]